MEIKSLDQLYRMWVCLMPFQPFTTCWDWWLKYHTFVTSRQEARQPMICGKPNILVDSMILHFNVICWLALHQVLRHLGVLLLQLISRLALFVVFSSLVPKVADATVSLGCVKAHSVRLFLLDA